MLYTNICEALDCLRNQWAVAYDALEKSWRRTVARDTSQQAPRLIPFIGAGLNRLVTGGISSWQDLITEVLVAVGDVPWSPHEFRTAPIGSPERLQLLLASCKEDKQKEDVTRVFQRLFSNSPSPSDLHVRLVELFPHIATTNYDQTLSAIVNAPKAYDLTNHRCPVFEPYIQAGALLHLHGMWEQGESFAEKLDRIFRGVGPEDDLRGPLLILTETQYHRLYSRSHRFQRAVARLFCRENLLLFLGAGLSSSEFGIQAYLRDLELDRETGPIGIYVGLDLNQTHVAYLRSRGIAAISLPGRYGWKPRRIAAVWTALFDVLGERFGLPSSGTVTTSRRTSLDSPDVLAVGLASRQVTFCLRHTPGIEASHWIPGDCWVQEAGGQHLLPVLHLVKQGRYVALAARVGDDEDADWVLSEARQVVEKSEGDLDTRLLIRSSPERKTRLTVAVTYPRSNELVEGICLGTRVLYNYEGHDSDSHTNWLDDLQFRVEDYCKLVKDFSKVQALYLGPYGLDVQELILQELKHVPLRFFETGTTGGPDLTRVLNIAKHCTHVLASAEFTFRVAARSDSDLPYDEETRERDYQTDLGKLLVAGDFTLLKKAHSAVFENEDGCYVVTVGGYGAACWVADDDHCYVPIESLNKSQVAWVGCGDTFRAEFIHAILNESGLCDACKRANLAAATRTTHVRTIA